MAITDEEIYDKKREWATSGHKGFLANYIARWAEQKGAEEERKKEPPSAVIDIKEVEKIVEHARVEERTKGLEACIECKRAEELRRVHDEAYAKGQSEWSDTAAKYIRANVVPTNLREAMAEMMEKGSPNIMTELCEKTQWNKATIAEIAEIKKEVYAEGLAKGLEGYQKAVFGSYQKGQAAEKQRLCKLFSTTHAPCDDATCLCHSPEFDEYWKEARIGLRTPEAKPAQSEKFLKLLAEGHERHNMTYEGRDYMEREWLREQYEATHGKQKR